MEDSNEQKCVQFHKVASPTYPLTLALPCLITKAIVFSAIIQCIQEFYIETSGTSAMFKYLTPLTKYV